MAKVELVKWPKTVQVKVNGHLVANIEKDFFGNAVIYEDDGRKKVGATSSLKNAVTVVVLLHRGDITDVPADIGDFSDGTSKFTEAEIKEIKALSDKIDRLHNEILCSNMADGRAYFDEEPLRERWSKEIDEAYAKIHEIAGDRDWIEGIHGEN